MIMSFLNIFNKWDYLIIIFKSIVIINPFDYLSKYTKILKIIRILQSKSLNLKWIKQWKIISQTNISLSDFIKYKLFRTPKEPKKINQSRRKCQSGIRNKRSITIHAWHRIALDFFFFLKRPQSIQFWKRYSYSLPRSLKNKSH